MAVSSTIDAPATPVQKKRLQALSPNELAINELAGEPVCAMLTAAPGNGRPFCSMTKLDECLQVLRILLGQNDTNGIGLAEVAIDRLLAATSPSDWVSVISELQSAILKATEHLPSSFAGLIFDFIENRERGGG